MKCLWLALAGALVPFGPAPAAVPTEPVQSLDRAFDPLVPPGSVVRTLMQKDTLFDGPTWVAGKGPGYLLFSDVPGNSIDKLDSRGMLSVYASGIYRGTRAPHQSPGKERYRMLGANGTTLDAEGRLVYCAFSDGEIVRIEPDRRRTILAASNAGRRLNAPNDLVFGPDGALYFTDSRAGVNPTDVARKGLYVLRAGKVLLLSYAIDHPNGLALSPDARQLYVTDTRLRTILRFDIRHGRLANRKIFANMGPDQKAGGPDGIKLDRRGNVYATGPGGLWVFSPAGKHIGTVLTPRPLTNLAFGGVDMKNLYMTAAGALYLLRLGRSAK